MLDSFNKRRILKNKSKDELYSIVRAELEEGIKSNGLWIKAKSNALGDKKKIEALYIRYRVGELRDEFSLLNITNKEAFNETSKKINSKSYTSNGKLIELECVVSIDKITDEVVGKLKECDRTVHISNNKYVVSPIVEQTVLSKFLFGSNTSYYDKIEDVIDTYGI
jgi:hypothetical protein